MDRRIVGDMRSSNTFYINETARLTPTPLHNKIYRRNHSITNTIVYCYVSLKCFFF